MDSSFCLFYQLQGDFNDLDAQRAAGGLGGHGFADMRADERLANRGLVGELAVGRIGFRRANNGIRLFVIGFVLTFVLTLLEVAHGKQHNFFTFQQSTIDFWSGESPYGKPYDFLYGPLFSILFAPFAYMGSTVGPFVWNLMNFTLFFYAIFSVPRITEVQKCKTYLYTALILATTQMSIQFNPVVAYLFLFAFSLLERGKPYPAILLILVSGFCKIYGIFELALLLCYPKFWRNMGFTIVLAAVLLVLPAVNLGFGGLIPHYERWAEVLSGHVDQFQFYAVFNLYPIHDLLTPVMTQVQIGSILALAVLFVIYYYNLDMKLMRSVVVPFLNKHYDSVKREHQI